MVVDSADVTNSHRITEDPLPIWWVCTLTSSYGDMSRDNGPELGECLADDSSLHHEFYDPHSRV